MRRPYLFVGGRTNLLPNRSVGRLQCRMGKNIRAPACRRPRRSRISAWSRTGI